LLNFWAGQRRVVIQVSGSTALDFEIPFTALLVNPVILKDGSLALDNLAALRSRLEDAVRFCTISDNVGPSSSVSWSSWSSGVLVLVAEETTPVVGRPLEGATTDAVSAIEVVVIVTSFAKDDSEETTAADTTGTDDAAVIAVNDMDDVTVGSATDDVMKDVRVGDAVELGDEGRDAVEEGPAETRKDASLTTLAELEASWGVHTTGHDASFMVLGNS